MLIAIAIFLGLILANIILSVYLERKVSAFIQDRLGPMEVGYYGILQLFADLIKLVQKEDIIPAVADRRLFKFAPVLIFAAVFAGFSVIPLTSQLQGADTPTGVFLLLAIVSLDILGILMAGWASNNKYSLFGAMRSVAQIVSYEIPLGLSILCVVMISQSLDLQIISFQQGVFAKEANYLFGIKALGIDITAWGGILAWNVFRSPFLFVAFIIYFIASLAECNRGPFDLPEAESELVGGFHTEYSGFRWSLVFLSEYGMMLLVSMLGAILFWGSWNTPLPNLVTLPLANWTTGEIGTWQGNLWGAFWLLSKSYFMVLIQMWVRWTFPRLRIDQLMYLCWKVLIPFGLVLVLISGVWRLLMI